ncbi:helix-turn-helix domain-containing protein [Kribbella sancticallisti]|uniref:Helix-turn-helix domain-containing protein n=1 Tax=Kribbella sancticallisti TaxID=460087 RepID=A0ABN2E5B9_9ACTN
MNLRDPAAPDSFTPTVRRLLAGEFDEGPGYATYRRRGTTDWLLFHTLDGEGRLGTQNEDLIAEPGSTVLIRPGTRQDYGTAAERWHFLFAHFHPRTDWLPLLDWPPVAEGILRLHPSPTAADRIARALSDAVRHQDSVLPQGELLSFNALEAALLWCDTQNSKAAQIDDRLLRAIEHIDRNLRGDLSIATLARVSTLSVSRFAHLFRTQLGVSPQQFVERRRLDAACRLLELTTRPIASIASEVGYPNPLYFSTRFRAHTSHSPTQYRFRLLS